MSTKLYDLAQLAGTAACATGAWLQWGTGAALIVGGALVLLLSLADALLLRTR